MADGRRDWRSPRDIFDEAENVLPVYPPPPGARYPSATVRGDRRRRWSLASVCHHRAPVAGPEPPRLLVAYDYRMSAAVHARATVQLWTGDWTAETVYRPDGRRFRGTVTGRARSWHRDAAVRLHVDCELLPGRTVALSADTLLPSFSVQCLQNILANGRLSVGYEMNLTKVRPDDRYTSGWCSVDTSLLAEYVGPGYRVSGKLNPIAGTAKMAYYHRCADRLQTGTVMSVDAARSTAVTRMGFRVLCDRWVFGAALGTDGLATGQWKKRVDGQASFLWSVFIFLNTFGHNDYGMGVGLALQ